MGSEGDWIEASPRDVIYSTVMMRAEEFFDCDTESWRPIFEDQVQPEDKLS